MDFAYLIGVCYGFYNIFEAKYERVKQKYNSIVRMFLLMNVLIRRKRFGVLWEFIW